MDNYENEVVEETTETPEEEVEEVEEAIDWEARARKAEAAIIKAKSKPKQPKQSDEFDYGEFAYLAQKGIESDEDIQFVKDSMKDSGKSLRDTLNASWFKAELEERKAITQTLNAVPKGKNANSTAIDSVEYWLAKPIAEVPQDMRIKVVNARLKQENSAGKFYNS